MLRNRSLKLDLVVFLFSLAVIQGSSYALLDNYPVGDCVDCATYMGISKGELDQSPVRRYRVLIPVVSGLIDRSAGRIIEKARPWSFEGDFSLCISFLVVNSILMSLFGLLIFKLCISYSGNTLASLAGLIVVLTCRWTPYLAGLPLTDSLYCLVLAMTLWGIRSGNSKLVIAAIFLGPWAKESYIFIAPIVLFCSAIPRPRLLLWFLASGILVFGFRVLYDQFAGNSVGESLTAGVGHLGNIWQSLRRLFSFHGLYEIFSVAGIWFILVIGAFFRKGLIREVVKGMESYWLWFTAAIAIHLLLSTEIARMLYFIMPLYAVFISLIISRHAGLQNLLAILPGKSGR